MYLGDNLLEQDLGAFVHAFESARDGADAADGADPAEAGTRPASVRHRRARRRWPRRAAGREARRPAQRPRARRRLPVRPHDQRGGPLDRPLATRRAGDHRRHPVAGRSGQASALRAADRLVDRHRQAHTAARGEPAAAREDRAAHRRQGRRRLDHRRPCHHRGGRRPSPTRSCAARW